MLIDSIVSQQRTGLTQRYFSDGWLMLDISSLKDSIPKVDVDIPNLPNFSLKDLLIGLPNIDMPTLPGIPDFPEININMPTIPELNLLKVEFPDIFPNITVEMLEIYIPKINLPDLDILKILFSSIIPAFKVVLPKVLIGNLAKYLPSPIAIPYAAIQLFKAMVQYYNKKKAAERVKNAKRFLFEEALAPHEALMTFIQKDVEEAGKKVHTNFKIFALEALKAVLPNGISQAVSTADAAYATVEGSLVEIGKAMEKVELIRKELVQAAIANFLLDQIREGKIQQNYHDILYKVSPILGCYFIAAAETRDLVSLKKIADMSISARQLTERIMGLEKTRVAELKEKSNSYIKKSDLKYSKPINEIKNQAKDHLNAASYDVLKSIFISWLGKRYPNFAVVSEMYGEAFIAFINAARASKMDDKAIARILAGSGILEI